MKKETGTGTGTFGRYKNVVKIVVDAEDKRKTEYVINIDKFSDMLHEIDFFPTKKSLAEAFNISIRQVYNLFKKHPIMEEMIEDRDMEMMELVKNHWLDVFNGNDTREKTRLSIFIARKIDKKYQDTNKVDLSIDGLNIKIVDAGENETENETED